MRAFVTEDESRAVDALSGGAGDKNVDAVFVDHDTRIVFIVQGKYRQKAGTKTEHRNDVMGFAGLALAITSPPKDFADFTRKMSPEVAKRLEEARPRVLRQKYALHLLYVTTGRCSANLENEAIRLARSANAEVSFQLFDFKATARLFTDYLAGVAPPVPSLDLDIESGGGVRTAGPFNRYDGKTDIEAWVFGMTDASVARIYQYAGMRLFARNVRGFLGSTEINRGMEETLESEPEYFWYYNNGITIVCDDAKQESARGRNILRVTNPQVINGQQTTRTLARVTGRQSKASVLVRVIRIPRDDSSRFETLVSKIVSATNWQNAIRPSDLKSNDHIQIEIERQFRKLGYLYIRKRMTKGEARRAGGSRHLRLVKKEEIAQSVAGCDLDPAIVREGKERLFEEPLYEQVFPNVDPRYYLSRYRLMREVGYAARGRPARAYAKWLVLGFMWGFVEPLCRSRTKADVYRLASEKNDGSLMNPLGRAIDAVFAEALRFYRSKKGRGESAADVSTFFQRRHLDKAFANHWKSGRNKSRQAFRRALDAFEARVDQAVENR